MWKGSEPDAEAANARIPGSYIVVFKDSVGAPAELAKSQVEARQGDLGFVYRHSIKGYSASDLTASDVEFLRQDPRVRFVSPNLRIEAEAQVVPTGVRRISAAGNPALDIDETDDVRIDADVAVIDTGVDYTHPDLNVVARTNCVPAGENPETEGNLQQCIDNSGTDGVGHGTHVAGTVGALDNGFGVVGVAPGARIWAVRVLNGSGWGTMAWAVAGIDWVTARASQIEVANMSLGAEGKSPATDAAIKASVEAGVVYVVAAGNESRDAAQFTPGSGPDVITVSALADYDGKVGGLKSPSCSNSGPDDQLAFFSNWGPDVEIAAPGVCIRSTVPGNQYESWSGTSMASPHVAGAAAVLASKSNPNNKYDVGYIRDALVDGGTFDWIDRTEDSEPEPLLYLGAEPLTGIEAATGGASVSVKNGAVLHGALTTRQTNPTYRFEYGETASYGQTAPAGPAFTTTTGYQTVSRSITGLQPGQTYHFRLALTGQSGTVYGADHEFIASQSRSQPLISHPPSSISMGDWMEDVSCSGSSCLAVGVLWEGIFTPQAASYRKNASDQWEYLSMPTNSGHTLSFPKGVSCPSATSCIAVGSDYSNPPSMLIQPAAWSWNGTSWTAMNVAGPPGMTHGLLEDLSCWAPGECRAVGSYLNGSEASLPWSATLKAGTWTVATMPGIVEPWLSDISCSSASACTAVGGSIVRWDGSSWTVQTPASPGTLSKWWGISCPSSIWCAAVGESKAGQAHAEIWSAGTWTTQSVPQPAAFQGARLTGISCLSSSNCQASGFAEKGSHRIPISKRWNGSTWEGEGGLFDADELFREPMEISCVSGRGCVSVGGRYRKQGWESTFELDEDVYTGAATNLTDSRVRLNGAIDPNGVATTYYFQYGKTTSYGGKAPSPAASAGSGNARISVNTELIDLEPETTYHYRLVASNASGPMYGADETFRTGTVTPVFQSSFGTTGTGPGQLKRPLGLAVDSSGNVWVADGENSRVQQFNAKGEFVRQFGSKGSGNGQFIWPYDIAITAAGDLWVTDNGNQRVQKFNSKGEYLGQFGTAGSAAGKFLDPTYLTIDGGGDIWVSDGAANRVQQFTSAGAFIRAVGSTEAGGNGQTSFFFPSGIGVDSSNQVWVSDRKNFRVKSISSAGQFLGEFGEPGTGAGQFEQGEALDVKPSGDVLVTDRYAGRVQQYGPEGRMVAQFGGGQLVNPEGIALGPDGSIYVSNSAKNRVERWRPPSPKATTKPASGVEATRAVIAGEVNPEGTATSYRFEYGWTAAYGSRIPISDEAIGNGTTAVPVSRVIEGLRPSTTYHYRVAATNSLGTVYGSDGTFTTAAAPPSYFKSNYYPLITKTTGGTTLAWSFGATKFKCTTAQGKATLASSSSELKQSMDFYGCTLAGLTAEIKTNGCTFNDSVWWASGGSGFGGRALSCPVGNQFTITRGACVIQVPPQDLPGTLGYANKKLEGVEVVDATFSLSGLKYTGGIGCAAEHIGARENGGLSGSWTLKAFVSNSGSEGAQINFWIQ